ncbi:hypothetical protein [Haloferula sp. BvORR071]|uniref:hypothetical protein n=1 Tax=Haloferula sp. BvORR071 TaxID=1396141 RepID=UPI00224102CF|nr:hypothetical protein [Haloferula sp. BvORR071]
MSPRIRRNRSERGFALVITLSLMVLLTILAVGLLSLSTISLRSAGAGDAQAQAYANARLAVMMAIGQLQKQVGDDRRVTADASISDTAKQPYVVGAWNSWSPKYIQVTSQSASAAGYAAQKTNGFRGWLMSSPDLKELKDRTFVDGEAKPDWMRLFTRKQNGFDLSAPPVPMKEGSLAWGVVQENTKARVNVAGPDSTNDSPANMALQAQRRPSLAKATGLKQPKADFNARANKVLSQNQIGLDADIYAGSQSDLALAKASYTTTAMGLATDAVNGGLKVDLSLGFEMSDDDFKKSTWGEVQNPFRKDKDGKTRTGVVVPSTFKTEAPLFRPLVDNPIVNCKLTFDPASVSNRYYAAAVPTFDHLRSFYRLPRYMYGGGSGSSAPTVAERRVDHVAVKSAAADSGSFLSPSKPPQGVSSVTGVKPVLNRVVYLLSMALGGDNEVRLVIAPIVSLWNPYNVALDIDGAVAYPWVDIPWQLNWTFNSEPVRGLAMSRMMGYQFETVGHGRQVNPYFLCQMSSGGTAASISTPIHFEPGEVRVFAPSQTTPTDYLRTSTTAASKAIWMRPVDNVNQMSTKGGLTVPMKNGTQGDGFTRPMAQGDTVRLSMSDSSAKAYHYFVTLEDGGRIRTPVSLDRQGGQVTTDVQMVGYASLKDTTITSPSRSFAELKAGGVVPFGVLETYERTAQTSNVSAAAADLIYTVNPRQASITHYISSNQGLTAPPHYVSTMRGVTSFDGAIQTTADGRRSFWGQSHDAAKGKSILPFFEIPREAMLSLGGFQHADLSSSTYGPANQFGNSWAPAWLRRTEVGKKLVTTAVPNPGFPTYDTCYLTNEALWDTFFFSGAAAKVGLAQKPSPITTAYDGAGAAVSRSVKTVLQSWVEDPLKSPLSNPRMSLYKGRTGDAALVKMLSDPEGCTKIAAHLLVDGAFNINSTDVEAWIAVLSGLRGESFELQDGGTSPTSKTAFPRFRHPTGSEDDIWNGFRSLDDTQIKTLATSIVAEVRKRGPFQSLAEFVNRRVDNTDLGRAGAIQTAIDAAGFNQISKQTTLPISALAPLTGQIYSDGVSNLIRDTGVGIPGYLTQADVLQSLAPVITCRSDTFTVRGYGETKDSKGNVTARAWCEAVVQRVPEFVDITNAPDSAIASLTNVNQTFGRRFEIVSMRQVPSTEIPKSEI